MNHEHYQLLKASKVFETFPKETQEFIQKIPLVPTEAVDNKGEYLVPKIEMEVELAAPEVIEVLLELPKSPRTLRVKPNHNK